MADPLHTTRIDQHPPFQGDSPGTATITSTPYSAPKYPSVYIGRKPLRVYLTAAESDLRKSGGVWIEARGDLISRAILVALRITGSRTARDLIVQPTLGLVMLTGKDGKPRQVPTIAILLWPPGINMMFPTVVVSSHEHIEMPSTAVPPTPLPHSPDDIPPTAT